MGYGRQGVKVSWSSMCHGPQWVLVVNVSWSTMGPGRQCVMVVKVSMCRGRQCVMVVNRLWSSTGRQGGVMVNTGS